MRHNRWRRQAQTETQQLYLRTECTYLSPSICNVLTMIIETGECVILSEDSTSPDNLSGKMVSQSELLALNMDFFPKVGISGETFNLTLTTACECDCGEPQINAQQVFSFLSFDGSS